MRIPTNLRRSWAGGAGSIPFAPVQVALAATALLVSLGGLSLALVSHARSHSPAPAFLSVALGQQSHSVSSRSTAATRTLGSMKTSVVRHGVRITSPWAHAELTSLDAGDARWTPYAGGAVRTTAFGTEAVTLGGMSAEEYLTVKQRVGPRTWKWSLDSSSRPRVLPDGTVEFLDAHGRPVLMHIAAPSILDRNGKRLATGPLHWGLEHDGARTLLTLHLDDAALPVPYTIDPAITLSASAYTVVKGNGGSTHTFSVNIPAGSQTGDLLVVQFLVRSASAFTTPAGWTLLASKVDSTDSLAQYMYTHVMTSTDTVGSTIFSMTTPAGADAAGGIIAVRNVDASPTNPVQAANSAMQNNGTATTSITTDSFIGSNNDYVIAFYGGMGQMGFTETNAAMSPVWTASSENQMGNGNGTYTPSNSNVSSGSSGASRADSLVTAGSFGASTTVSPSATLSTSGPWIMNVLAFRVALPWNQTLPTISGTVAPGQTLTAATGTWSNSPTGYTYQWQDCDSSGNNCTNIAGATGSTYTLAGTDSGSTIEVRVTAANANGTGQTVSSAATTVVPAADGSGTLTTPTTTVTAGSTGNTVTFTYTAAPGGIVNGKVQLTVPAGWTAPSKTGSNGGYTTSSTGTVAVAGQVITVSGVTLAANATLTITYGSKASAGPGATATTTAGAQSWSAASASTSTGTITALAASPSITVNPAAATKLVWTQQPSNTGSGSAIAPSPAASVEDTYGNVVTSSTAPVTVAIGTNPGGGTLSGTATVNAVAGVATFAGLSINKTGTGYTLNATSTGLTSATSSAFNVTVGAPAKLAIVQGPTNTTAGSSISPSVTVAIQDAAGNTVTTSTAAVSLAIGTNPSGGTLSGTATVNAVAGIATFSGLSIDKAGTGYTLGASSTGLTGATSGAFNITPGAAAKLAFVQGPTSVNAGATISPAVSVAVTDALGNTVTTSGTSVSVAIGTNPGGGTLSGTATTTTSSGVATFSNLSINKAGSGYTLNTSSGGLTGATSSAFNINVAAVDSTQSTVAASPTSLTANGVASSTVTVTAKDAFGNAVSGQVVTLGQGGGSSTITTVSGTTNTSGVATFTVTDTKAEAVTYSATIGATGVLQTATVTFNAGLPTPAQSGAVASPLTVTADGAATSTVTVTLKDANGNVVPGKTVSLAKSGGSSTITAVSATTNASGQATFTVKDTVAESTTYTATDTTDSVTVTQQPSVTFTAGPVSASTSTVAAAPSTVTANGSTTSTVTVTLLDAHSNPVAGKTVSLAKSGGSSTITAVSATTNASGQATFTVKDVVAESTTYTATDTTDSVTVTPTATVTFAPGVPTAGGSALTVSPASATANGVSSGTATVTLRDANGNVVPGKSVSLAGAPAGTSISPASATTNASGQASFTVTSTTAGLYTLTATDTTDSVTVTQQPSVTFVAGAVSGSSSTVSAAPSSVTADGSSTSTVTVTLLDAHSNPVAGKTVSLAKGGGSSTITAVSATTDANGHATFTVKDTVAENATYTATDTTDGVTVAQTAGVSFVAGAVAAGVSTVAAAPGSVTADGATTSTVTVTLKDANGNPVAGKTVSLAKAGGSSTITAVSPTTDASGHATFTVKDTVAESTTYTATDTTDSVTVTPTATVTFTVGAVSPGTSTVNAAPATLTADGTSTSTVTVTLKDATGNAVAGKSVALAASPAGSSISPASATTNASGQASFTVSSTAAGSVAYTATDTTDSVAVTQQATVTYNAGAVSSSQSTISASVSPVVANGSASSTITVTAKDAFGNPVAGQPVTLAQGGGSSTITTVTGTTTAAGVATFTVTDTKAETVTYSATVGATGVLATAPVAFEAGAVSAAQSTVASSPGSVTADGSTASTVTVTLNDAHSNPVAGKTVSLAKNSGSSTVTAVSATTDAGGHATFHVTDTVAESSTYTATDTTDSVTVTPQATVLFTPGAATHFTVAAPASSTAGSGFGVTVTAYDANGNLATGYTGSVHLTSSDTNASLPADATASNGTVTFGGVTLKTSGSQTVTATDGGVTGTSGSIAVGAGAAASLTLTTPASATAGAGFGAAVTAHDAYGNVATGYAGTVHLTSSDTNAALPADVTASSGVASFTGLKLKTAGSQTVSASDGSLSATSGSIAVSAAAAATFTLSAPANATAGAGFSVTATAYDAYGNLATGYAGTVGLTSGDAQAVLPADVTASAGVATFTGVDLRTSGSQSLTAADGGVTGSTSVSVTAAAATSFDVSAPSTATAGAGFSVTVTARDAYGNVATGYSGSVHLTSSDAQAALPADANASNGTVTFNGVTLKTSGSSTVSAAGGSVTGTSGSIAVGAASAASLAVTGPATATAGTSAAITVTAYDAYGNVATGYTGSHPITFSGASSSAAPVTAPTVTNDSGTPVAFGSATQLTFTAGSSTAGGSLTLYAAENATIAATDGTLPSSSALSVAVSAGSFSKLAFALASSQTNGSPFSGTDTLTAEDAYGNTVTTFDAFSDNVTISANGGLTGAVSGLDGGNALTASSDFVSGVANLNGFLTYTGAAGSGTFTATSASGKTGTSGSVTVAAGAATGFALTGASTQTAGQPQTVGIRAVDASGNTATTYTGDHSLTFSGASAIGSFAPTVTDKDGTAVAFGTPATITFANGVATAGGSLVLYKTESATIGAAEGSLVTAPADRLAVDVSAGAASSLELGAATTSPVAGVADALAITARDAYGNVATGYTGDQTLTFGGATTAGSFVPTVTDTSGSPVDFGTPTTIRFTNGVSTLGGSLKLYTAETATVTVSDGSHGNGAGTAFTVSAAAACSLAVTSVNSGTNPTAGVGFPVVVRSLDQYGNRSPVSSGTGVALSVAAGTGSLGGTTTGTIAAGQSQATVSGVTYTKAETGVQIEATRTSGDSLSAGTSTAFTVSSSADRLVVTSVDGGSSPTAGQPFSVTVQAEDGLGNQSNVVSDTTVTLAVAAGSGSLGGTVTATIPAGGSQATVSGLTYDVAESGVQLRASASGGDSLLAATSAAFTVQPGAATSFGLAGSGTETAGAPNALTVTAYDAYGNVATSYAGDHSLTFSGASSIGTFAPTATAKDGTAVTFGSGTTVTFANGVSTAGGSLVLYSTETAHVVATAGSVTTTAPFAVAVSPASASSLRVSAPGTATAGGTFTTTATALDPYGNTATSFTGGVSLGSSDANAVLPTDTNASAGVATFTGVRLETAGAQTVTASSGSLSGDATVAVSPAAATHLAVNAPASATAGAVFGVTVRALDAYGNLDTSFGGTVALASVDAQAVLPGDQSASGGIATFGGAKLDTAGTQTVDASSGGLAGGTTVVVGAAPATHFSVTAPASATAGAGFGVTVTALDPYGNTDTSYAGTVGLSSGDSRATMPAAAAANAGSATFAGVKLGTAGAQSVDASDGSLNGSTSVAVDAAAATHFSVSAPANATAGAGFGVTVTALDGYGNTDTSYTGTVHLSSADTNAAFPADTAAVAGVATFTGAKLGTAGTDDVTASAGALTGTTNVDVAAGAATHFAVSTPASATAGSAFGVTVTALDAYGNTDTSYGGSVHLASDDAQATLPADVTAASGVAAFAGVKLGTAGTDSVDASAGTLTGTASVVVSAAAATHLVVSAPPSATAGSPFAATVTAEDAYGNTDTGFGGTVHLASGDTQATLPADVTATGGVASFSGIELGTAGSQSVDATGGGLSGSSNVTIAAGTATSLAVTTSAASAAAGDPLDVTVTAKDAYGNVATGYRGDVALSSNDARATLAAAHTFGAGDAGTYTFTSGATFGTAGTDTVTASDSTLSGTSGGVTVSAGAPAALVFGAEPTDAAAGSPISPAVTVRIVDAYGNLAPSGAAVTVSVASGTGAAGATLSGTLTENAAGGVATFAGLSLDKAAAGYELAANASGLAAAQSSAFAIGAGAADASQTTLAAAPASVTADGSSAATVTVQAHDAFGNAIHTGGADVVLSTTLGSLSSVTDNGDGTYTATLTSTSAGSATVSGTLGGAALANDASVSFTAGSTPSAAHSSIVASPTSLTAGSPSTLTVQARDAFGNPITSGGALVVLSTDLGTIGAVTDNGDGTYTATLTSNVSGTAHVTGTLNGIAIGTNASVAFAPGAADAAQSIVSASPASLAAGSSSTITVRLEDAHGNALTAGGDTVALSTDLGSLSSVTDNGDGTYTATLSSTAAGDAHVTGTVNGAALSGTAVSFSPAAADASRSTLVVSPSSLAAGWASTVTVTLADTYGNRLTAGGDDVRLATDLGTLSAVADNGDGSYTATLTSTGTGTAHVTGTVNGAALTGATVDFVPGAADAAHSTLAAAPGSLTAGSTSTVTVSLADAYGNALRAGGDDVRLATDLGSLSAVTDNGDGTYTATLDSTVAGDANVTGTVNGSALTGATVHYAAGAADAAQSTVSASPASLAAGATSTVTVSLKDANGNALTTGGDTVLLATDNGTLSTVTDNHDGTYTATLRATTAGAAHVTGTVNGSSLTGTTVSFSPAAADATQSSVDASPASLAAGATSTVTVQLRDAYGNALTAGGDTVTVSSDRGTVGSVVDNGDGTYATTLSATSAGDAHVTATVNGNAIAGTTVTFVPAAADATQSTLTASPSTVAAGSASTVTVRLRDAYGNALTTGGDTVVITSDHGTVGTVVDNGDGTYTTAVSATAAGDAHVTATVNGNAIAGTTVTFVPAAADATQSSLTVSPATQAAGTPVTVTVRLRDAYGNALTAGGDTVALTTDLGTLGAVADNGDGSYTATLTSTLTGTAHVTGTVDGAALAGASVDFVPGAASATTSTLGVAPATTGVDNPTTITVQLEDANGNALTAGGDDVLLATDLGSVGSVTDNGDGTYTASLDSTVTGTAHVTGTVNGAPLTGASVTFTAGAADASTSTLAVSPASLTAGGSATVTVDLRDSHGNALTTGGDDVRLATDLGTLTTVTDNHDGSYTATLSSTTAGTAHVTGTLNGAALTGASASFTPAAADASASTLSASPAATTADSTSTVTVHLKDAYGNALTAGGDDVRLATDLGSLSAVADNGDGSYTATLSSSSTGTAHVTGTVNGAALSGTSVAFAPGAVSAGTSTVTAGASSVRTDGSGTTVTVTVLDAHGNPIPNAPVILAPDSGSSTIDPILGTDTDSAGVATFTVADTTAESVVYSATAAGTLVTQTAGVQYLPGAADAAHSSIAAAPSTFTAGGSSTVTVQLADAHGNALVTGGDSVALSADTGSVGAVTDHGNGAYTATLTSTAAGTVHVTGTVDGASIPGNATVTVGPGTADAAQSTIGASPSKINADGTSGDATITVHARDAYGNALTTGGATVALSSTLGTLSGVTDNGDGTYTATLAATGAIGTATITGTLGGTAIGDNASVELAPPVPTAVVDSAPTGTVALATATFTFHSGNDPGATFECKLDGGSYAACTSPQSYSGLADGAHTFSVRGVNVNGPGTATTSSWTSDVTPPTVALTTAPGAYTNNSTEQLAATAADATSGVASVDFLFAATAGACPTGTLIATVTTRPYATTWTLPADGRYVVCAVAHDVAGNSSDAATSAVVVDTTKPTISFPALGTQVGSDYWVRGSVDLHTTSFDQTSGVASVGYTFAGAANGTIGTVAGTGTGGTTDPYDETWDTTAVADGRYTVTATSTDEATNADSASQVLNVDNTPPTASLDDPGAFGHGTIPLTVTASDTGSGVDTGATLVQSSPAGAGTWTTIADPSTWTPADGDYDLRAVVTDNVGNQTITATRTILVDNTPPTVTDDSDGSWHANDVTVDLSAVDAESGVATVEYKVDSGAWTTGTTVVIPAPADGSNDGTHTITYHATNRAGVTSTDATATVKIDHTPPSNVTLDSPAAGSLLHGTLDATQLAGTAQDATSGIASTEFRIAAAGTLGANPCNTFGRAITAPFDTSTVADGTYDLWYVAIDAAGNGRCSVVPHTVTIDNTPPVTTDDAPFAAQNSDVTVHLNATDATSGVASTEYSVDGGAWTTGNAVTIAAPADHSNDGTHTISYRSTDNAGNVEATQHATVVIDTTAPTGTATDPSSLLTGTVQLDASPTDTDIASVEWLYRPVGSTGAWTQIGTDTAAPWEMPWITTAVPDGAYDLEAISTDSTGNETTQLFSTKTVDNTAPDSAAITAPGANADLHGTISFSSTATDATSGIDTSRTQYEVQATGDSGFHAISGSTWDSTSAPDGPAQVRVAVWDRAGNGPLYSAPVSFTVDNTAPTVALGAPAATNGNASLSATGSADIASVEYDYRPHGGGAWTTIATTGSPFTTTWSTNGLPEGLYDVQVTATDGGGNTGTATATVLVDRTPPTASLTAPAAGATVGGSSVALAATSSDADSGVASVVYRYRPHGSGAFTDISGTTWDVSSLASGDYDLQVVVTDKAGNTATDMRTVTVDSTPPSVSSFAVASPQHGTIALQVAADGTAAKVVYGIAPSGGSWTQVGSSTSGPSFSASFDSTTVADGTYDFRAIVSDSLGNETTVDVPNVTIDNTPPSVVSSVPADGAIVPNAGPIVVTTSEPVASVSSLELDGSPASFTPSISGTTLTFATGGLAPGNHALTGNLVDAAGNSMPFRINVTVDPGGGGAVPVTTKNTNDGGPTTLASADGSSLVTVPTNVWQSAPPSRHDWLVLKVNPSPAPWEIPAAAGAMPGSVLDVRMFWDLAGTEEHQFDAPIQIDLNDPSGTSGTPATAEVGGAWRAIPELTTPGTLPAGQPDGYWRTGATVHVLTHHLSLFTVLAGTAGTLPVTTTTASSSTVAPPIDFAGVFATDGLTLRWVPGMPTNQISEYILYGDGQQLGVYGPQTYEAKLGMTSAADARRFTIVERATSGETSGPSAVLRIVPAVAGLSIDQADAALTARNLVPGQLVAVPSTAPPGTVVGPTDLSVLAEGSTVDLQVSDSTVARSPFAFSVASAPTVAVTAGGNLVARIGVTTRSRIDVTIDAYPYVRIHRWHFFHVPAGTRILHLRLGHPLAPGQYRLFWKATSDADHTVQRKITPLRIAKHASAPKDAAIVVVSSGRNAEAYRGSGAGLELLDASIEQAFLYATYHEVRGFVLDAGSFDPQTVAALRAVYANRGVVVLTSSGPVARAATAAGAVTLPPGASSARIAALVARLDG